MFNVGRQGLVKRGEKHPFHTGPTYRDETHTLTPNGNVESPVKLGCMLTMGGSLRTEKGEPLAVLTTAPLHMFFLFCFT